MSLFYRGVKYEPTSTNVEVVESESGQYRGATFHFHKAKSVPAQNRVSGLKYRGATVR